MPLRSALQKRPKRHCRLWQLAFRRCSTRLAKGLHDSDLLSVPEYESENDSFSFSLADGGCWIEGRKD